MLGLGTKTSFKTSTALGTSTEGFLPFVDVSDVTSMFVELDGSGGNPGPGDPVGLILNKGSMGNISARAYIARLPNFADDFTSSGNWGTPTQGVTDNGDGTLTVADVGGTDGILSFQTTNSVGDWVYISVNITVATATNIVFRERNSAGAGAALGSSSTAGAGVFTAIYKAGYANSNFAFQVVTSDTSATIDSFELKVIPNEHLTAPTDSQRPVLDVTNGIYSLSYDGVDDGLTYTFPGGAGPSDCSVFFAVKTTDQEFVPFSSGVSFIAFQDNTSNAVNGLGNPVVFIDGIGYPNPVQRSVLLNAVDNDEYHNIEYRGCDLSADTSFNWGTFPAAPTNNIDGQLIGPIIIPNCTEKQRLEATKLLRSKF